MSDNVKEFRDNVKEFRKIFDQADIVKRWKEFGFFRIGTMFFDSDTEISFIRYLDGTYAIEIGDVKISEKLLNLINDTLSCVKEIDRGLKKYD